MWGVLAIVMATLTLGLVPQLLFGQIQASDAPPPQTIQMVDAKSGWATLLDYGSGESMLIRTTDGGSHWRDVTPLRSSGHKVSVWKITPLTSLIAWVVPSDKTSTGAEIFRTVDGGRAWTRAFIPARGTNPVASISFIDPREGWLLVSLGAASGKEDVAIFRSTDGGENWIAVVESIYPRNSSGLPFVGNKSGITFVNLATGWITGVDAASLYVYVTHDGGRTWRRQDIPLPRGLIRWWGFPEPPKFFTARDGVVFVRYALFNEAGNDAGEMVVLHATHDGGATWTHTVPVRVDLSDLAYYAVADMNHAWVMIGGILHATQDGGRHWATMPLNPFFAGVKQIDFTSPQLGWAIRRTSPFLVKTLDGGRAWTPVNYMILR